MKTLEAKEMSEVKGGDRARRRQRRQNRKNGLGKGGSKRYQ
ncbi:hypothetical protein [Saccharicrinis aurantiacus]|nr:hypothetical protein [Saccharicrinis aurantiacus]